MLTFLKHAYSTRLKSSKHAKMSANISIGVHNLKRDYAILGEPFGLNAPYLNMNDLKRIFNIAAMEH